MSTPPRETTGEKPIRVRRGRVDSVDLFEIKDSELDALAKGPPADIYLNFAIFLLSIAFTALLSLCTATTFRSSIYQTVFLIIIVVGLVGGALLLILWRRGRRDIGSMVKAIRDRIPPDTAAPLHPDRTPAEDEPLHMPDEPKG